MGEWIDASEVPQDIQHKLLRALAHTHTHTHSDTHTQTHTNTNTNTHTNTNTNTQMTHTRAQLEHKHTMNCPAVNSFAIVRARFHFLLLKIQTTLKILES